MKQPKVENIVFVPLTEDEAARLKTLQIGLAVCNIETFDYAVSAGAALAEISDDRLYRAKHKTFAKYVTAELNWSRGYAYELMGVSTIVGVLSDASDIAIKPTSITQVKRLLRIKGDPEKLIRAWKQAVNWTDDGGHVTVASINSAVQNTLGFERRKQTHAPKAKPQLYARPEKMAKYIMATKGQEYANALMVGLMEELRPTGALPTARGEAVA